ncbi:kinase-like domain-containing protein, partial [Piptocephalis cylindrospora]
WIRDKEKPLTLELCISFATDTARALAFLHARDIIHRDIKGENLLVTDNGRIKVCDFGFSRLAARGSEEMKRISYCGTDEYMAPEIMLGMEFGTAVDTFSFGMILAELLTRSMIEDGLLQRDIPGFSLQASSLKESLYHVPSSPEQEDLVSLCLSCTRATEEERPQWKETLQDLRFIQLSLPNPSHPGTYQGTFYYQEIFGR